MWSQIISSILFSRCSIWIKYQPNPCYGNPPEALNFAYCRQYAFTNPLWEKYYSLDRPDDELLAVKHDGGVGLARVVKDGPLQVESDADGQVLHVHYVEGVDEDAAVDFWELIQN